MKGPRIELWEALSQTLIDRLMMQINLDLSFITKFIIGPPYQRTSGNAAPRELSGRSFGKSKPT